MDRAEAEKHRDHKEMLRAQAAVLLSQARAQAIDIQRALSMAQGNPVLQSRLAAAAAHIDGVVAELSQALSGSSFPLHTADLMALQTVVQSGEAHALLTEAAAQAASSVGGTATPAQAAEIAAASADTRHEVESLSHDLFDRHLFDPYLHFSSPEDEAAFRKREAEDRKYISDQLARGTPEGNLNASGGTINFMLDAHAHGAGDSPEFMPRWNALMAKTQRQYAAMRAAGQSTQEFDRHVSAGVRRFLKDEKHLPDAEIERRLAGAASPLALAQSLLRDDRASHHLELKMERVAPPDTPPALPRVQTSAAAATKPLALAALVAGLGAQLKDGGVKTADASEAAPIHGLTAPKPASPTRQSLNG